MPFVLDASVTMAWCFEEEITPYARTVLDRLDYDIGDGTRHLAAGGRKRDASCGAPATTPAGPG